MAEGNGQREAGEVSATLISIKDDVHEIKEAIGKLTAWQMLIENRITTTEVVMRERQNALSIFNASFTVVLAAILAIFKK